MSMIKYSNLVKLTQFSLIAASILGFIYGYIRGGEQYLLGLFLIGFDVTAAIINGFTVLLLFDGILLFIFGFALRQTTADPDLKRPYMIVMVVGISSMLVFATLYGIGRARLTVTETTISPEMATFLMFFGEEPVKEPTGWAYCRTYDPVKGINISTSNIRLYWTDNLTHYATVSNNQVFFLNGSTLAYLNHTGYYPIGLRLEGGTQDNPRDNYLQMRYKPPDANVTMEIIKIDNTYGSFNASDIPNGAHTIVIQFFVNSSYHYGHSTYVPSDTLPIYDMFTKNLSIFSTNIWLGINGSASNLELRKYGDAEYSNYFLPSYDINVLNVSSFLPLGCGVYTQITFYSNNWMNVNKLLVWDGLIDGWSGAIIKI